MKHLAAMFNQADRVDRLEGKRAYIRYHQMMLDIADHYQQPVDRVTAAFVALSPNSDYLGNLRSLVSLLDGVRNGLPETGITVSTYKHCRDRAFLYLTGAELFLEHAKGLKTRAFYTNIVDPYDPARVTVDGHIYASWRGVDMTTKQAKVSDREYREIEADVIALAEVAGIIPNQFQATVWFARKRVKRIIFDPQGDLFFGGDNQWRTTIDIRDIKPYPRAAA